MNKFVKELLSTSVYLLIVLVATYLIVNFVGQRTIVNGASMEPTLYGTDKNDPEKVGDNLIVDKITYRFNDPKRFDIIVFPFQYSDEFYIKRIIGMPGETVQIDEDGVIYVNGTVLKEGYGKEVILDPGRAIEPVTLGADEYFVLGDNRNNSADSRSEVVGNIHREDIIGRAWFRIWPLSRFGILEHQ
ncbi:MAG: signal peptidase I [Lachnospiraceae bacterium]|nr:signal peptidase I [Lachnospiraceae bacterium]